MDELILKEIYEHIRRGERAVLATLTQNTGSTPRKAGSVMAVFRDGSTLGSVGGGALEHEIILKSLESIKKGEDMNFEYRLDSKGELGMECGGEATGFIKVFKPKPRLLIAGAGHIGVSLSKIAKIVGFYTVVFDDREEYANRERLEDADEIIVGNIGEGLSNYSINEDTYVVIVTRGHSYDSDALKATLCRGAAYVGMIGSSKKILHVLRKMLDEGIDRESLEKVYTPIGIDIASELPEEISISIMAEILAVKNNGKLVHRKSLRKVSL